MAVTVRARVHLEETTKVRLFDVAELMPNLQHAFSLAGHAMEDDESVLPWTGEEHSATGDVVCAVESMDGAQLFTGEHGRGSSVMWEMAPQTACGGRKWQSNHAPWLFFDQAASFKIDNG